MHLNGEYKRIHLDEPPPEDAYLSALLVLWLFDLVGMFPLCSRWRDMCLQYYWHETKIRKIKIVRT